MLEKDVEEKYYLSYKAIGGLINKNNKLIRELENPKVSSCIIAGYYKMSARDSQFIKENTIHRLGGIYDTDKRTHQVGSIYNSLAISPALTDMSKGGLKQPLVCINEGTKKGYSEMQTGDSINLSFPNNTNKRGRVGKGVSQTITTCSNIATLEVVSTEDTIIHFRIRKLTPLECWRLMRI